MLAGCATVGGKQIESVSSATAKEEWAKLSKVSSGVPSLRTYANVRIESTNMRRSFNAKISVDRYGSVLIEALTPLGTSAFTLFSRAEGITFVNHIDQTYWKGSATDLAGSDSQLRMLTAAVTELPYALVGLPEPMSVGSECDTPSENVVCMQTTSARFLVTPNGVKEVAATSFNNSVIATFDPPAFPPQHSSIVVTANTSRSRIDIDYRDIAIARSDVKEPRTPRSYRCCVAPALK